VLLLGPDNLPSVARAAGKTVRDFRRVTGDLRSSFERQMAELEKEKPPAPRLPPAMGGSEDKQD
jgi:Sec-independent protein translocase protein TatA